MRSDAYSIYDAIADIQLEREATWRAQANCLTTPIEVFFDADKIEAAKAVCRGCLVQEQCSTYRQSHPKVQKRYGVFAGRGPRKGPDPTLTMDLQ